MLAAWRKWVAKERLRSASAAERRSVLEQHAEPLGVIEGARLGNNAELFGAFGQAVQIKGVQEVMLSGKC